MSIESAGTTTLAGHRVPRLGYGTMRLTGPHIYGPPADRDQAIAVVRRAIERGVRVIDTAWYYGPDVANEIVAEAIHPYPEDLVIVTKLGGARRSDGSWYAALRPDQLREGCETDLRQLKIESVPVVHLRWMPQDEVSFTDFLGTLIELRDEGKVQHIGLSNVELDQLETALSMTPIVTVSNQYSVLDRTYDSLLERCELEGIAFLPYFPLAASPASSRAGVDGHSLVDEIARGLDASATQVAIAWLLARSPAMIPIPGTSSLDHLNENLDAASLSLSEADLAALETAAA